MKIAFFDSGIGGVSVLHRALQVMPEEDYLYFADTDHVPYGTKTTAEVRQFVLEAADFILNQDVKALVVACNTATSVAINDLRARFAIPILGMEPAVKPAVCSLEGNTNKRVLVTATPMTLRQEKLHLLLKQWDQEHVVDLLPLPALVEFAEAREFTGRKVRQYLKDALTPFPLEEYCSVVLGCTHFNYFKDTFRSLLAADTRLIDGSEGTVRHLQHVLKESQLEEKGSGQLSFYASGRLVASAEEQAYYQQLLRRLDALAAME